MTHDSQSKKKKKDYNINLTFHSRRLLHRGTIISNSEEDRAWHIHHKHQPLSAGKVCAGLHPRKEDNPPGGYTE